MTSDPGAHLGLQCGVKGCRQTIGVEDRDDGHGLLCPQHRAEKMPERQILTHPDFFQTIDDDLDKSIVKEYDARRTILLVALGGKLTENADPNSRNLMVNDESGAGKDYVTREVLRRLPPEDVVARKRITEKVFTYWHNAKFEPAWTWDGKIFYGEDVSNNILNSDVFKVMASSDGHNVSTVIFNQTPIEVVTKGKPVMIITIATASPKKELLRRFPIVGLTTTEAQTKLILERKAAYHARGERPTHDKGLTEALRSLRRVRVRVPFAGLLVTVLNTRHVIVRTHFDRLVDYIKFSAAIHQYQRERDDEGNIIAGGRDYDVARSALLATTSNAFSVPLTKNQRRILSIMESIGENAWVSVSDLEPQVTFASDRTLRTELDRLTEWGFLDKDKQDRESSKKPVMVYRYLGVQRIQLPDWETLQNTATHSTLSTSSTVSNASNDGTNETIESNERQIRGVK